MMNVCTGLRTFDSNLDQSDSLDTIVSTTFPGCIIKTKVIGILIIVDEKGIDQNVLQQ